MLIYIILLMYMDHIRGRYIWVTYTLIHRCQGALPRSLLIRRRRPSPSAIRRRNVATPPSRLSPLSIVWQQCAESAPTLEFVCVSAQNLPNTSIAWHQSTETGPTTHLDNARASSLPSFDLMFPSSSVAFPPSLLRPSSLPSPSFSPSVLSHPSSVFPHSSFPSFSPSRCSYLSLHLSTYLSTYVPT